VRFNYRKILILLCVLGTVLLCAYRLVWFPPQGGWLYSFNKLVENSRPFSSTDQDSSCPQPHPTEQGQSPVPYKKDMTALGLKKSTSGTITQKIIPLIFKIIQEKYVDQVGEKEMIEGAIQGICSILDPHCTYFNPEDLEEFFSKTKGSFAGLGLELMMEDGQLKVVNALEDTPAYEAGLRGKDTIIAVDGTLVHGLSIVEVLKKIKGKEGTVVELTLKKPHNPQPITLKVTRKAIQVQCVKWELKDEIGYIRITVFDQNTLVLFKKALGNLQSLLGKPLKGLIVDVRNNSGGLLSQAVHVSNLFISEGIIVSGQGRTPGSNFRHVAKKNLSLCQQFPIVVLINENSASAAEIFAAALQDHKKALIVGSRSFGKGSVQELISLGKGLGGVKLTISLFYRPNGQSIQGSGVEPNIIVEPFLLQEQENPLQIRENNLPKSLLSKPFGKPLNSSDSWQKTKSSDPIPEEESFEEEKTSETQKKPEEGLFKDTSKKKSFFKEPSKTLGKKTDYQLEVAVKLVQALDLWQNRSTAPFCPLEQAMKSQETSPQRQSFDPSHKIKAALVPEKNAPKTNLEKPLDSQGSLKKEIQENNNPLIKDKNLHHILKGQTTKEDPTKKPAKQSKTMQ
jgi:carboxyl-terminal processing protease